MPEHAVGSKNCPERLIFNWFLQKQQNETEHRQLLFANNR